MSVWTLHTGKGTCGLATHIALHEAGAEFEVKLLNFGALEQQSPEYLRINPKGRVPALVTPQGTLTETPALLFFVAQQFPQARLAPLDNTFALAKLQEFNNYLCSSVHVAHAHKRRGARWVDDPAAIEAMKAKVPHTMRVHAEALEAQLSGASLAGPAPGLAAGPYVLGAEFSVADAYLYTIAGWLEADGVDTSAFPRLLAHRALVAGRPAVQRAEAEQAQ